MAPESICADPLSFYFEATIPGPNPVDKMIEVFGCKGDSISWSGSQRNSWLSLSQTGDPDLMNVSVDVSGITRGGVYNGVITISASGASNSPLEIPVKLNAIAAPFPVENLEAYRVDDSFILEWDPSDAGDLAGYKVYYDFDGPQPPFNGTGAAEGNSGEVYVYGTETARLTGLPEGVVVYVSVTAFDYEGNESDYSNVVVPNSVSINNGAESTSSRRVKLYFTYSEGITHVRTSNNDGASWSRWRRARERRRARLGRGKGEKSIYVQFKGNGQVYGPAKDTIIKR